MRPHINCLPDRLKDKSDMAHWITAKEDKVVKQTLLGHASYRQYRAHEQTIRKGEGFGAMYRK